MLFDLFLDFFVWFDGWHCPSVLSRRRFNCAIFRALKTKNAKKQDPPHPVGEVTVTFIWTLLLYLPKRLGETYSRGGIISSLITCFRLNCVTWNIPWALLPVVIREHYMLCFAACRTHTHTHTQSTFSRYWWRWKIRILGALVWNGCHNAHQHIIQSRGKL